MTVIHFIFAYSRSACHFQQQHFFSTCLPNQLATPLLLFPLSRFLRWEAHINLCNGAEMYQAPPFSSLSDILLTPLCTTGGQGLTMLPSPKKNNTQRIASLFLTTFSFLIHHVDKGAESQSSILANLLLQGNKNSQSYIFIFNIDCIYASSKTETEQVYYLYAGCLSIIYLPTYLSTYLSIIYLSTHLSFSLLCMLAIQNKFTHIKKELLICNVHA